MPQFKKNASVPLFVPLFVLLISGVGNWAWGARVDCDLANALGRKQSRLQQQYNVKTTHSIFHPRSVWKEIPRTADSPYWDLDENDARLRAFGTTEGTAIQPRPGILRVHGHHSDKLFLGFLRSTFGEPTGYLRSDTQSSLRTLTQYTSGMAPYQIKLGVSQDIAMGKQLVPDQIGVSVARSADIGWHPNIVEEPAGLAIRVLDKFTLGTLYRKPYFGVKAPSPRRGDTLVTLHSLLDTKFRASRTGKRWMKTSEAGQGTWLAETVAPEIGRLLGRSWFELATHLEMHTQNLDFLVTKTGAIRHLFAKDLNDTLEDPLLRMATGREVSTSPYRWRQGYANEAFLGNEIPGPGLKRAVAWQKQYTGQILELIDRDHGDYRTLFRQNLWAGLEEVFLKNLGASQKRHLSKYFQPYSPKNAGPDDFLDQAMRLRELYIKADMEDHFVPDNSVVPFGPDSLARPGILVSDPYPPPTGRYPELRGRPTDWFHELALSSEHPMTYGHYRGYPAAIERGPEGEIQNYFVVFPQGEAPLVHPPSALFR